jgi:ketosteroid isomerase-like protein
MVAAQSKMTISSLATSDRLDILEVLTRAEMAATARDADAYVELFTDDAVLDGAQGIHRGREALRQAVGPIWASEGSATFHLLLNAVIDRVNTDCDEAIATSILLIVRQGTPPQVLHVSEITQQLKRVDGYWKIARRSVKA